MLRRYKLLMAILAFGVSGMCAQAQENLLFINPDQQYFVTASVLNVRDAPVSGKIVHRLHRGQMVVVFEIKDGWARVTPVQYGERWVSLKNLNKENPETSKSSIHHPSKIPSGSEAR